MPGGTHVHRPASGCEQHGVHFVRWPPGAAVHGQASWEGRCVAAYEALLCPNLYFWKSPHGARLLCMEAAWGQTLKCLRPLCIICTLKTLPLAPNRPALLPEDLIFLTHRLPAHEEGSQEVMQDWGGGCRSIRRSGWAWSVPGLWGP